MAQSASGCNGGVSAPRGSRAAELDATGIVSVLNAHAVRYVIIGAFAAIAQQAPIAPTRDIELTPDDGPTISNDCRRRSGSWTRARALIRLPAASRSTMTPRR
jgi:hypothetical protein